MISYLRWQFISAPAWLILFAWNLQHALIRFFSVPVMIKTLFSHWHKDIVSYNVGGLSAVVFAFAWNQISRGIGFIIRTATLAIWLVAAAATLAISIVVIIAFVLLPFIIITGFIAGLL
jgi:hypothetical protein